jgi:crotonobetainyl-CoA:carnitine CoA-transferase CaiB-like acyl-CoA transferase
MIDMANPNKFSAGLRQNYSGAPLLGGDTVDILSEIGYAESDIDEMVRSKTVIDGRERRPQ